MCRGCEETSWSGSRGSGRESETMISGGLRRFDSEISEITDGQDATDTLRDQSRDGGLRGVARPSPFTLARKSAIRCPVGGPLRARSQSSTPYFPSRARPLHGRSRGCAISDGASAPPGQLPAAQRRELADNLPIPHPALTRYSNEIASVPTLWSTLGGSCLPRSSYNSRTARSAS